MILESITPKTFNRFHCSKLKMDNYSWWSCFKGLWHDKTWSILVIKVSEIVSVLLIVSKQKCNLFNFKICLFVSLFLMISWRNWQNSFLGYHCKAGVRNKLNWESSLLQTRFNVCWNRRHDNVIIMACDVIRETRHMSQRVKRQNKGN